MDSPVRAAQVKPKKILRQCRFPYPVKPRFAIHSVVNHSVVNRKGLSHLVSASYFSCLRNPKFWPEPEAFKPSRFLDDKDAEFLDASTGAGLAARPKSETGAAEVCSQHRLFLTLVRWLDTRSWRRT